MSMISKCAIEGCENKSLISYNGAWICGECMEKILEKIKQMQNKMMEELKKIN